MGFVTADGGRLVNTSGGVVHFTAIAWAGEAGQPSPGTLNGPRDAAFRVRRVPRGSSRAMGALRRLRRVVLHVPRGRRPLAAAAAGGRAPRGRAGAPSSTTTTTSSRDADKWRLLERNRWATIVRCYPASLLVLLAPALLATELALRGRGGLRRLAAAEAGRRGETVRALPRLLRERRAIQRGRTVSATEFAAWLTPEARLAVPGSRGAPRDRALGTPGLLAAGAARTFVRQLEQLGAPPPGVVGLHVGPRGSSHPAPPRSAGIDECAQPTDEVLEVGGCDMHAMLAVAANPAGAGELGDQRPVGRTPSPRSARSRTPPAWTA